MRRCNCCKKEDADVKNFKLPMIGYGSAFDCLDERDITEFNLCPECAVKMNKWIKGRLPEGVTLEDFWKCKVVEKKEVTEAGAEITYYEYEHEQLLVDVFVKFMPSLLFGENYKWEKLKYQLFNLF